MGKKGIQSIESGTEVKGCTAEMFVETRNFSLNEPKSIAKKLSSTDKENFDIVKTGGGTKITFNTGTFELFKAVAANFYASNHDSFQFEVIPVTDEKGNIIEIKYKTFSKGTPVYTLNLYNTTSTCLVNGRKVNRFLESDFPTMLKLIDEKVSSENTSIEEINQKLKSMLKSCQGQKVHVNDENETITSVEISCENGNTRLNASEIEKPHQCISADGYEVLSNIVQKLNESVYSLKETIEEHIKSTDRKFSQIKDEITSVKRQITRQSNETVVKIDELNEFASNIKQKISSNNDDITRKLQSLTDVVKNMPLRGKDSQTNNVRKAETATPQDNPPRDRTLLIGDSILKGINSAGLGEKVDVNAGSGARIHHLASRLRELDVRHYANIIIFIGGNDVSSGSSRETLRACLREVIMYLHEEKCTVHVCTVCPRRDADVRDFNNIITEVCVDTTANVVDCYNRFIYGDGNAVSNYYAEDGIHLNVYGTKSLVSTINKNIQIIKPKDSFNRHKEYTHQTIGLASPSLSHNHVPVSLNVSYGSYGDANGSQNGTPRLRNGAQTFENGTPESRNETVVTRTGTPGSQNGTTESENGTLGSRRGKIGPQGGTSGSQNVTNGTRSSTTTTENGTLGSRNGELESRNGTDVVDHGKSKLPNSPPLSHTRSPGRMWWNGDRKRFCKMCRTNTHDTSNCRRKQQNSRSHGPNKPWIFSGNRRNRHYYSSQHRYASINDQ